MDYRNVVFSDDINLSQKLGEYRKRLEIEIFSVKDLKKVCESYDQISFLPVIINITTDELEKNHKNIHEILGLYPHVLPLFIVDASLDYQGYRETEIENELFYGNILRDSPPVFLAKSILNAFTHLHMMIEKFELQKKINTSSNEISKLTKIGISLANEKDYTKLLHGILFSAREIANADSGSLYLVEKDEKGNPRNLRFKISSMKDSDEFILPIDKKSIAGYVAYTGRQLNISDVYKLTGQEEYKFNKDYDVLESYHTRSMLTVPMKNHRDEVVGVIQIINRKRNFHQKLTVEQMAGEMVQPFDRYTENLVMSVAGQAAVAIQNNNLLQEIEALFEGFVTASVSAIEARDPTTSGHSFRVANLTVALAELVDRLDIGTYSLVKFTKTQIKELRYASLLHDFGKVGVREKVLVKAKKLENYEMDMIRWRFSYIKKDLEAKFNQKKIDYVKRKGLIGFPEYEKAIDMELKIEIDRLDHMIEVIINSNEPTILEQTNSQWLDDISKMTYTSHEGQEHPLLSPIEYNYLSIKKGSLDFVERKEIESHVEHSFQFLSKIPWTTGLKMVPAIAHAHHEKLNGTGYPRGLNSEEIPVQSKMMTISDIFDALTDSDRPYKKAVPLDRALDILKMEVKDNHVDKELLDIFIEGRVFEKVNKIPDLF